METIGVICPSEIAYRRFMPSLCKCPALFGYAGVACADECEWHGGKPSEALLEDERRKAAKFEAAYGGAVFDSYAALLDSDADCIYLPLPPALHYQWGKAALERGKHVLFEKPFTTSLQDTRELIALARARGLAVHENYMFQYHSQIGWVQNEIEKKAVGDLRLIRIDFGFPFRGAGDFRYSKGMGGGALLDCGGYTVKLASLLLGKSARLACAFLNSTAGFDVDIYGNAAMVNDAGLAAQLSFGMDNHYRCNMDIWGSKGSIFTDRILTAPDGFEPAFKISTESGITERKLPPDDAFKKSIEFFHSCIAQRQCREESYCSIIRQAEIIEDFRGWAA